MRVLIALLALIVLVGCTTPPTTNIESPQTAGVRTCIDLDENGLCDDIEKKAPVEAPKPIVEEKVEVEVPVEAPIAPKPVTVAEPKVSEPEVSEVRKTEPKATAKSYLAPFEGEKTFIILDSERNKGGAVAASSDIIAYFGFPKTLKVDAIDTYSGTVDDYSDNLIFLGNACANGFTADLYEIK